MKSWKPTVAGCIFILLSRYKECTFLVRFYLLTPSRLCTKRGSSPSTVGGKDPRKGRYLHSVPFNIFCLRDF
uniref:Putative secreted protein n=1 Tax=Anopheles darlingi TaxID=43151 RepID=A0A2M4DF09_ANODA